MRVGIVAGEASGDALGAGLIEALRARVPDAVFEGVAGPRMVAAGCRALFPASRLAVMGLVEVLRHLPDLLRVRRALLRHFLAAPPDVFIGIDSPDFNLGLERRLRAAGVPTVHYVSPSVWAWREGRVRGIARAADLVLTLFPFEPAFYARHGVAAEFVGHPAADAIAGGGDARAARRALGLDEDRPTVTLLPGSRLGEIERLGPAFLGAATLLARRRPRLQFVAPMASREIGARFGALCAAMAGAPPVVCVEGRAHEAMTAADVVLLASGTATLEALLLRRPMVVAYRLAPLTHAILKGLGLLKIERYALPNILAGRDVVPEFMQDQARAEPLALAVESLLDDHAARHAMLTAFDAIHAELRRGASERAASAVLALLRERGTGSAMPMR